MSAAARDFSNAQNKTKARYLVALKNVLDWEQIRHSVALYDELCASGVEEVTPEHFGAVIASKVRGTSTLEHEIVAALSGQAPAADGAGQLRAVPAAAGFEVKMDAPTAVFNAILNSVMLQVADKASGKLNAIMRKLPKVLASSGGVAQLEGTFQNWVQTFDSHDQGEMAQDLPVSSITTLMDSLYGIICDNCGPQFTDKAIDQAISDAEKLPEARKYPPRQLL